MGEICSRLFCRVDPKDQLGDVTLREKNGNLFFCHGDETKSVDIRVLRRNPHSLFDITFYFCPTLGVTYYLRERTETVTDLFSRQVIDDMTPIFRGMFRLDAQGLEAALKRFAETINPSAIKLRLSALSIYELFRLYLIVGNPDLKEPQYNSEIFVRFLEFLNYQNLSEQGNASALCKKLRKMHEDDLPEDCSKEEQMARMREVSTIYAHCDFFPNAETYFMKNYDGSLFYRNPPSASNNNPK